MSVQLRFFAISFFVLSLATAHAEEATPSNASHEARTLGHRGLEHYSAGRFELAEEDFRAAERFAHSPVFLLYQARSQRALGQLLSARRLLEQCANEEITASAPVAWSTAVSEAAAELVSLSADLPRVSVTLTGGAAFPIVLHAGSQEVRSEQAELVWELDPGLHEVIARDASGTELVQWLYLKRAENSEVNFAFPERRVLDRPLEPEQKVPARLYRNGAHAAFVLGASSLVFSAIAGTIAFSEAERVKRNCAGTSCRSEDESRAHNARRWANLSTMGATVGLIGVGAGVGLLFYPSDRGGNVAMNVSF
jgi:hypothetical protein